MPSTEPSHHRAQHAAEALVLAATPLYAAEPPHHVTVDQIARAAGVPSGVVFVHFGSLERLYLAVVERSLELCRSYTARRTGSLSPVQRMRAMGEAFVEFALEHPDACRVVSERATTTTGVAEYRDVEDRIADLLQRDILQLAVDAQAAMDAGEIRRMPVQQVVGYFWVMWQGMIGLTTRGDAFRLPADQLRRCCATLPICSSGASPGLGGRSGWRRARPRRVGSQAVRSGGCPRRLAGRLLVARCGRPSGGWGLMRRAPRAHGHGRWRVPRPVL